MSQQGRYGNYQKGESVSERMWFYDTTFTKKIQVEIRSFLCAIYLYYNMDANPWVAKTSRLKKLKAAETKCLRSVEG